MDAPEDVCCHTIKLVCKHTKAFGFDDWLGTLGAKASIQFKDIHPISVLMYGASPMKWQFIDKQMDKWIRQEVIEPSISPWAAPVIIVYRYGKPRFCVDYQKLNAATILDEFPIPCQ